MQVSSQATKMWSHDHGEFRSHISEDGLQVSNIVTFLSKQKLISKCFKLNTLEHKAQAKHFSYPCLPAPLGLFQILYVCRLTLYLMHEDQGTLMAVVHFFIAGICYTFALHLFPSLLKIVVPQLVAARHNKRDHQHRNNFDLFQFRQQTSNHYLHTWLGSSLATLCWSLSAKTNLDKKKGGRERASELLTLKNQQLQCKTAR